MNILTRKALKQMNMARGQVCRTTKDLPGVFPEN